jgi:undecaprenyl-diphosphatase
MEHIQAVDMSALSWFGSQHSTTLDTIMKVCTHLGDKEIVLAAAFGLALMLYFLAGKRRTAVIFLAASLLGIGVGQSAKYLIQRPRPNVDWRLIDRPHSTSFPSGHSIGSMALYGTFALLAARHLRNRAAAALVFALGFTVPLLVGITRPYLGVHYPSDVLAGWTVGLACALLALWADRRWGDRLADTSSDPPNVGNSSQP